MIGKGDFFALICLYRKFTSPRKKYKKHSPTAFYEWDQKVCERTICNMRIACLQYANGKSAIRILFPRLESHFLCILIFTIPLLQHKSDNEFPLKPE